MSFGPTRRFFSVGKAEKCLCFRTGSLFCTGSAPRPFVARDFSFFGPLCLAGTRMSCFGRVASPAMRGGGVVIVKRARFKRAIPICDN